MPFHTTRAISATLLLVFFLLLSAPSSLARTIGGTRSKLSPSPLFGLRFPNRRYVSSRTSDGNNFSLGRSTAGVTTALLEVRGGSSLGGGRNSGAASYRPTPKSTNPFRKTTESTKPNFRIKIEDEDKDEDKAKDKNNAGLVEDNEEEYREAIDSFLTRDSRNTFISRVYGILSIQLTFTAMVCLLFGTYAPLTNIYNVRSVKGVASPLLWAPLVGCLTSTIAWFRIAFSPKARQKSPNKWVWLTIFTLGESVTIGAISSLYKLQSVITAMGATAVATIAVSLYVINQKNPKYDLSQWGATLSSWTMILLFYGLLGLAQHVGWLPAGFLPYTDMLYSVFATFLFSLYLAYHTKLIVGGKHSKYQMNEKDYVFGAMALYVDIVNIFLHLLRLLGSERDS